MKIPSKMHGCKSSLIIAWLIFVGCFNRVLSGCSYPSFVQSTVYAPTQTRREWYSHIEENARDSQSKYYTITNFAGHAMITKVYGGQTADDKPAPFTRECSLEIKPGHYLSVHKEKKQDGGDGGRVKFLCMAFVERSADVFQLKTSSMSDIEDPNLCNEELALDNWVYVNRVRVFQSHHACDLHGGYSVKIYDKNKQMGVCDAYEGETRIEAECMKGEGIFFRFRHSNCVPHGLHMHQDQQTFCMASWQDGANTFSILRHDRTDNLWCLRYPSKRRSGAGFLAYLFRDVYCETANLPWDTDNYLVITMMPDEPRGIAQLCMDDYEACKYWTQPCRYAGHITQLTCAKMCSVCSDTRPAPCNIPAQFHGEWLAKNDNLTHRISVDDSAVRIRDYADLQCVQWDEVYAPASDMDFIEQMFVTTFENGCRPRYTCAQLKKHSPSILRYKLSEPRIWPFENTNGLSVECGMFKYSDLDNPVGSHFHSRHFHTIISETERIYVDCSLDEERKFDVIFQDGVSCSGTLTQKGLSTANKMKLVLNDCDGHQSEQEFACLDSSRHGYLGEHMMVTETLDSFNRIRCWMFPTHPERTFYLLDIAECNEGANAKISTGNVRPLATFKEHPKMKLSIVVENGIQPSHSKSPRADAVRKAPYLREDGQHWKDVSENEDVNYAYNDAENVRVVKTGNGNVPKPVSSATSGSFMLSSYVLVILVTVAFL